MNKHFKLLIISLLFVLGVGNSLCFAQESTETPEIHDPAEWISGTLPVLYINTENSEEITSKDNYLTGTYYLDALGLEGYESIGSTEAPLPLQIKGRGNATWNAAKKPYRIKLDKKAALMGMKKNKHFVLLSNVLDVNFKCEDLAFWLGQRLGMDWTPSMKPIELVINGDYRGLYYLCEKIRVEPDRVNVFEQADEETDPEAITGGWLVEIDNYTEENQITIPDRTFGGVIRFTSHTPEVMSEEQKAYLTNLVTTVDDVIYNSGPNSTSLADYVDIDALARFYVVNEIMDNGESFSGSCYWHKEKGEDSKIVFGPLWDFGSSFCHGTVDYESFIYDNTPRYARQHWIGEIAKFHIFQAKVREVYQEFKENHWDHLFDYFDNQLNIIRTATVQDHKRWPQYGTTTAVGRSSSVKRIIRTKVAWLDQQWSKPVITATPAVIAFSGTYPEEVETGEFTVTGTDLRGDINVTLSGDDAFSIDVESIAQADAGQGAQVVVTFAPVQAGSFSATVTLSSEGADDVTVTLSGEAEIVKETPVMETPIPETVSTKSFMAVWNEVPNVESYTLQVVKQANGNGAPARAQETVSGNTLTVTGITETSYVVANLDPATTYNYRVKAVYTDGDESDWSNAQSVTTKVATGIGGIAAQGNVSLAGNVLKGNAATRVYNAAGIELRGNNGVWTLTAGTYIVVDNGTATKIQVK